MTKRALVSAIRPSRSTEAIAIGVLLKKRAKRISAMRPASRSSPRLHVEDERARGADRAVGGDRHAMEEPHRQPRAVGAHEVEVERLRLGRAGLGRLDDGKPLDA